MKFPLGDSIILRHCKDTTGGRADASFVDETPEKPDETLLRVDEIRGRCHNFFRSFTFIYKKSCTFVAYYNYINSSRSYYFCIVANLHEVRDLIFICKPFSEMERGFYKLLPRAGCDNVTM